MIYLVFACFCVFFALSFMQIKRESKHDDVLFPFCQLRRDVMKYRYEAIIGDTLSHEEMESLRSLSRALDGTIRNYKQHKTVMFNIRKVARYIKQYRHAVKQIKPVDVTNNAKIQEFRARFGHLLAKAFIAYTPLIRWEVALRLIAQASRIGYRAGKKTRIRRLAAEYVANNAEKARSDARRYGLIGGGAPA